MVHVLLRGVIVVAALLLGGLALSGSLQKDTLLEEVRAKGVLTVVTRLGPASLHESGGRPAGMDYDLARAFADHLGVSLRLLIADTPTRMFQALGAGNADLAAGALGVTESLAPRFRFSRPYARVRQHVVYRRGAAHPATASELATFREAPIRVAAHTAAADRLRTLVGTPLPPAWRAVTDAGTRELLYEVWTESSAFTIVNSNELSLNQAYYPELRVAFTFDEPEALAWSFRGGADTSLHAEAERFLQGIEDSGELARIRERYYGHLSAFDYVGARTFLRHVTERLPRYRALFEEAAAATGLDWRLLAAIGYQESLWDPDAVSPTGVRGLMMLTRRTAAELGLDNRVAPSQSIHGGARYFRSLRARLPERIAEPTRTWLALAAYNVGMGHLEDARRITESRGGNPDHWSDVRASLPLLSDPEWYEDTRYGQARGEEPVQYVRGVRSYYALLARITDPSRFQLDAQATPGEHQRFRPEDGGRVELPALLRTLL